MIKRMDDFGLALRLVLVFAAASIGCVCDAQTETQFHVIHPNGTAGLQELLRYGGSSTPILMLIEEVRGLAFLKIRLKPSAIRFITFHRCLRSIHA